MSSLASDGSTNAGCPLWDNQPAGQADEAYSVLKKSKTTTVLSPGAPAEEASEERPLGHDKEDSHSSQECHLSVAAAENRQLKDLNIALEGLLVQSNIMEAIISVMPPLKPAISPGPSPSSVISAMSQHMWELRRPPSDAIVTALSQLPPPVLLQFHSEYCERLQAYAAEWTTGTTDREELTLSVNTAMRVRWNVLFRMMAEDFDLIMSLLPAINPPPPGTPRGDRLHKALAAVVKNLSLTPEQKSGIAHAWSSYCSASDSIQADMMLARQELARVEEEYRSSSRSMHGSAKLALSIKRSSAGIRHGQVRLCVAVLLLKHNVCCIMPWVQWALAIAAVAPYEVDIRSFCRIVNES